METALTNINVLDKTQYIDVFVNSERWLDIETLPNEIWVDIKDFKGLYQISNYSRVKSLGNKPRYKNRKDKILKSGKNSNGYYVVILYKDGSKTTKKVHRLVAEAFLPNYDSKPCVDHYEPVESDYCNNCAYNLRWVTMKENMQHSIELGRFKKPPIYNKIGKNHCHSKPVIQFDLNGHFVKQWDTPADVERMLGYSRHAIYDCCNGRTNTSNGFVWQYGIYDIERGDATT